MNIRRPLTSLHLTLMFSTQLTHVKLTWISLNSPKYDKMCHLLKLLVTNMPYHHATFTNQMLEILLLLLQSKSLQHFSQLLAYLCISSESHQYLRQRMQKQHRDHSRDAMVTIYPIETRYLSNNLYPHTENYL